MQMEWLSKVRIELYRKIARQVLNGSASAFYSDDSFIENNFAESWKLTRKKKGRVDAMILHDISFEDTSVLSRLTWGGTLFLEVPNTSLREVKLEEWLTANGLTLIYKISFGFLPHLLTFPFYRLIQNVKTGIFTRYLAWLTRLELPLHPNVRLPFGLSTLIVAKRLPALEKNRCDVTIIIPAYNEEKRIVPFLTSVCNYIKKTKLDAEVIVVDDGSEDQTHKLCSKYDSSLVKSVSLYCNFGKGGAMKEGVRLASGTNILFADADGATPIDEFAKLKTQIDMGFDIAIGSRYHILSNIITEQSFMRRLFSQMGNFLIRSVTGLSLNDTQCGFKMFRYTAAKSLFKELNIFRFGFDFEILSRAKRHGYSMVETPVQWHDHSKSKVPPLKIMHLLKDLILLRFGYFIRFSFVGVINTIIDYAIHNTLTLLFGRGDIIQQTKYQFAAFLTANLISFLFNSGFTFKSRGSYMRFFTISAITLVLTTLSFYGLNMLFNPTNDILLANILKLSTVAISFITNYFGYKVLVFHK